MKKLFLVLVILLFSASTGWTLFINDGDWVKVGEYDPLYAYNSFTTANTKLKNSGYGTELDWVNEVLEGTNTFIQYGAPIIYDVYNEDQTLVSDSLAFELIGDPTHFLVKFGAPANTNYVEHALFTNKEMLNWAVINTNGLNILNIQAVSHWGEVNGAPVPEPATMLLLGTGLIGLAVTGRKKFIK